MTEKEVASEVVSPSLEDLNREFGQEANQLVHKSVLVHDARVFIDKAQVEMTAHLNKMSDLQRKAGALKKPEAVQPS